MCSTPNACGGGTAHCCEAQKSDCDHDQGSGLRCEVGGVGAWFNNGLTGTAKGLASLNSGNGITGLTATTRFGEEVGPVGGGRMHHHAGETCEEVRGRVT